MLTQHMTQALRQHTMPLSEVIKQRTATIQKNDRVEISGIFISHNFRNNRCIIQLLEPKENGADHEHFNGQHIEVDEKYIKCIPPPPSTASPEDSPSAEKKSENKNVIQELTKRHLEEEWNNMIGDNDAKSIAVDAAETCDSWTLNDCDSCKRVLFCLSYYRLWIIHKQQLQNKNENIANNTFYVEYLVDFIDNLRQYSSTGMLNDFHHIKQFHTTNNKQNHHSINNQDKQDIFEYFKNKMGICNYTNCRSYSRNHRDRDDCTQSDTLRRKLYFIDEAQLNMKSDEITETNVQQLFDMIHCTLLHPHSSAAGSGSSKFVTEIKVKCNEEKKQHIPAEIANAENEKLETDEEQKTDEKKDDEVQTAVLSSYGFGAQFKYHREFSTHANYVEAKWKDLKQEILSNALYRISEFDFDSISKKCEQYLQSYRGRLLIARRQSNLNNICGIRPNTMITMGHIITLMLYTNMDELQKEFKKGCRYLERDNQKIDRVKKRNREIANWCKLLWESVTFYGESVTKKQVFYHGLSCRLLFDSVIAAFNCPTSTTVNKSVAYNFSSDKGIIVQLSKFASLDSHFLDVSDLSDYPNEQERLFFQAQLGFQDIIYQNTSNKYFIKCLSLFQNITKGNFFTHDAKIFKNKHQKTLIKMMNSVINREADLKIPEYMQQLFKHYCVSIRQFGNIIWINKEEFSKLSENTRQYLSEDKKNENKNSFLTWLKKEYHVKIKYPQTMSYVVKNHEDDDAKQYLTAFWNGKSVMLPSLSYIVRCIGKKSQKINLKLKLKKGATVNDGTAMIVCKISNNKLPAHIQKLKCDIGIFCPQINFSYTTAMTVSKKLQGIPLCESTKLDSLEAFEWKIFVKFRGRVDSNNMITKFQ